MEGMTRLPMLLVVVLLGACSAGGNTTATTDLIETPPPTTTSTTWVDLPAIEYLDADLRAGGIDCLRVTIEPLPGAVDAAECETADYSLGLAVFHTNEDRDAAAVGAQDFGVVVTVDRGIILAPSEPVAKMVREALSL